MNWSLILNILNFVLGGFATTLGWLFATLMSAVLIVTLPYTRSCWEICKMSLVLNVIWVILFGWWLFLAHVFCGISQCLTIIGIPTGLANFHIARIALFPVGQRVVPKAMVDLIRQQHATQYDRFYK